MEMMKNIGAVIVTAVLAAIGYLALQQYIAYSNVQGLKGGTTVAIDASKTYLSESPVVGTYNGITLSNLGYASTSVTLADNAVYLYNEQVKVDSDNEITVQDKGGSNTTYTSVSMLGDSDTDGDVDNADVAAAAVTATGFMVMLDTPKPGLFVQVEEGDTTNGGAANSAVFSFGVGANADYTTAELASFESSFRSSGKITVINGSSATDGVFRVVVAP